MIIPKQLQNNNFRFVLIASKSKAPYESQWTKISNYPFSHRNLQEHKGNLGIVCGYGNLVVLDIDNKNLIKEFDEKTSTLTTETGSGGRHYYFICENAFLKNYYVLGEGAGELRITNSQVLISGCIHPNGNEYKVLKDFEIQKITKTELKKLLGSLLDKKEEKISDISRSGQDWHDVCEMIEANYSFDDADKELMLIGSSRWQDEVMGYKVGTFCNALRFIKKAR